MRTLALATLSAVLLLCSCSKDAPTAEPQPTKEKPAAAENAEAPPKAPEADKKAPDAPPSDVPDKIEGANLTAGTLEADGLKAENLSCKLEGGGGLLAGPLTIGAIAKEKAALDACVKEPTSPRVAWTAADALENIRVAGAGSPAAATCIAAALAKVKAPGKGECATTLVLGNKE